MHINSINSNVNFGKLKVPKTSGNIDLVEYFEDSPKEVRDKFTRFLDKVNKVSGDDIVILETKRHNNSDDLFVDLTNEECYPYAHHETFEANMEPEKVINKLDKFYQRFYTKFNSRNQNQQNDESSFVKSIFDKFI